MRDWCSWRNVCGRGLNGRTRIRPLSVSVEKFQIGLGLRIPDQDPVVNLKSKFD